jgi:hypothetical protein
MGVVMVAYEKKQHSLTRTLSEAFSEEVIQLSSKWSIKIGQMLSLSYEFHIMRSSSRKTKIVW